jgi:heme-degrading monooxygenase HmoA
LIVRIWRTRVRAEKEADYESFAREHSLPMFGEQAGFLGVFFVRSRGHERAVISLWRDRSDVDRLEESPSYRQTVERIEHAGILSGEASVDVFHTHGFELSAALLDSDMK